MRPLFAIAYGNSVVSVFLTTSFDSKKYLFHFLWKPQITDQKLLHEQRLGQTKNYSLKPIPKMITLTEQSYPSIFCPCWPTCRFILITKIHISSRKVTNFLPRVGKKIQVNNFRLKIELFGKCCYQIPKAINLESSDWALFDIAITKIFQKLNFLVGVIPHGKIRNCQTHTAETLNKLCNLWCVKGL